MDHAQTNKNNAEAEQGDSEREVAGAMDHSQARKNDEAAEQHGTKDEVAGAMDHSQARKNDEAAEQHGTKDEVAGAMDHSQARKNDEAAELHGTNGEVAGAMDHSQAKKNDAAAEQNGTNGEVAGAIDRSQANKNKAAAEQDDTKSEVQRTAAVLDRPEGNLNKSACRRYTPAAILWDLLFARSTLPGTLLFLFVAILVPVYHSRAPMCELFGSSGYACVLTEKGCLLPKWVCANPSLAIHELGDRDSLATVVAVNSRSRAMEDFIAGSNNLIITEGFDKRRGYADLYRIMETTRKQSVKVRNKAEDVMDRIPDTANDVEQELKRIRVRASAMEKYFDEEPEEIIVFLQSLSSSLNKIIALVDEEARLWEELHGEVKLLLMEGSNLLSRLNVFLSIGEVGRVLRRAAVLAPLKVTKSDRVAGGFGATGGAVALTYGVCAVFPALAIFAGPAGAALTVSFNWLAHKRARNHDAQYYHADLVHKQVESILDNMQHALPTYLESVEEGMKRIKAVSMKLTAVRDSIGDANTERVQMVENRRVTRTAMSQFISFLDTGINDMEGVRNLALLGREQLQEHVSSTSGRRARGNVVSARGAIGY